MTDQQWNDLLAVIRGERIDPLPIGFIIDSPWLPGCKDRRYRLVICSGEVIEGREELIARSTTCFPHAVVKTGMDIGKFIKTYDSNHIHAVTGDYKKELLEYCRIAGIEADVRS